jgi:LysM repeat protein
MQPQGVATGAAAATSVIHVFRAGDSLARIASAYGLSVEQLASANGLTFDAVVTDGTRLVIPLRPPTPGVLRAAPGVRRTDRTG